MNLRTLSRMAAAELRRLQGRFLLPMVIGIGALHGVAGAGMIALGNAIATERGGEDSVTALVAVDLALRLASLPVNGLALLLIFAVLWAEDYGLGTMGAMLSRPVRRVDLFVAKALAGLTIAAGSLCAAGLTGFVLGAAVAGFAGDPATMGPDTPFVGWMAGTEPAARVAWTLAAFPTGIGLMLPALGVSALCGALTRSPVGTLFGSIAALLTDAGATAVASMWSSYAWQRCGTPPPSMGGAADAVCEGARLPDLLRELTIWAGRGLGEGRGSWELYAEAAGKPALVTLVWTGLLLAAGAALLARRDVP
jgi:hypothetical protein